MTLTRVEKISWTASFITGSIIGWFTAAYMMKGG